MTLPVREDLSIEQRAMAYTVIDNIDLWLSKERWLKGGWFAIQENGPETVHTECLANIIRRVERGGARTRKHEGVDEESYAETRSMTEGFVAQAIKDLFPGETRHMHYRKQALIDMGHHDEEGELYIGCEIDPAECELRDGKPCATCRAERYSDEITIGVEFGPFNGTSGDDVIPSFNDHIGTRHADVQAVIDHARELISGVPVTNAQDVMSEQERMEIEILSIEAQADIDEENIRSWFGGLEQRGWVKRKLTERDIERRIRRLRMLAEKDKEVVRQDCTNCA